MLVFWLLGLVKTVAKLVEVAGGTSSIPDDEIGSPKVEKKVEAEMLFVFVLGCLPLHFSRTGSFWTKIGVDRVPRVVVSGSKFLKVVGSGRTWQAGRAASLTTRWSHPTWRQR